MSPRATAIAQVCNLTAGYGKRLVLTGVTLAVSRGEWFALLGPNGSGKSTLLRCLGDQLTPSSGEVFIGGHSIRTSPREAKSLLGYAHAPERLPGLLTGRQCLEVYASAHGLPAIGDEVLDLAQRFKLHPVLDQLVDSYSLGTRQKLSILLALINDPPLVVLDEAFNGLDPASGLVLKQELHQRVAAGRCAVVLATHALDIVLHYASRAGLLLDGKLATTWSKEQIEVMRRVGPEAIEIALAEATPAL
jgi:ABC-2 type transport system ATP-binding protein